MTYQNFQTYVRKLAAEVALKKLYHASHCRGPCDLAWCLRMKRIIKHNKICKAKHHGACQICVHLVELCFYHASKCDKENCLMPFCIFIKKKLKAKRDKQRKLEEDALRRIKGLFLK